MSKEFAIGVSLSASLARGFASTFKSAEDKAKGLQKTMAKNTALASAGKSLAAYQRRITDLTEQQRRAGTTSDALNRELKEARAGFTQAASAAEKYGVAVDTVIKHQARYEATAARASRQLERRRLRENNSAARADMHGQLLSTAAMVAPVGLLAHKAIAFEDTFADVKKVEGLETREQYVASRSQVFALGNMGMHLDQVAAIRAAGLQSNIAKSDIQEFTRTAIKMGVAFDMAGGQAGETMSAWRAGMGLTQKRAEALGDAVNHLSNNMNAKAGALAGVMQRQGSVAMSAGLSEAQAAALGAAILSSGASEDVAGTAMKNFANALTKGPSASKAQRALWSQLGFVPEGIAKAMQKDSQGTIMKVLERIAKSPDWLKNSMVSELFGEESKGAIMPMLANLDNLARAFELVGQEANYAGSMSQEYAARAETTKNKLKTLGNMGIKAAVVLGDSLLPHISQGAEKLANLVSSVADLAAANPEATKGVLALGAGLIGLKAASLVGSYALTGVSDAVLVLGAAKDAGLGGLKKLRKGVTAVGGAMLAFGKAPVATVVGGVRTISAALIASPIAPAAIAIAGAGFLIWRYWAPIKAFASGFWTEFSAGIARVKSEVPALAVAMETVSGLFQQWDGDTAGALSAGASSGRALASALAEVAGYIPPIINYTVAFGQTIGWAAGGVFTLFEFFGTGLAGAAYGISLLPELFSGAWRGIKTGAQDSIQYLRDKVQGAVDWIKSLSLFEAGKAWIHSLIDGVKSMAASLMATVESTVGVALEKVSFGFWKPGPSSSNTAPKIEPKAKGGLVASPIIGLVGEAGPEMIIPLTDRARGLSLLGQTARHFGLSIPSMDTLTPQNFPIPQLPLSLGPVSPAGPSGQGAEGGITLNFAPQITVNGGADPQATGQAVQSALQDMLPDLEQMLEAATRRQEMLHYG